MTDEARAGEPRTEAGRRLLERESFNSRSFALIRIEDIREIEREAEWMASSRLAATHECEAAAAPALDVERLAGALLIAEELRLIDLGESHSVREIAEVIAAESSLSEKAP